MSAALNDAQRRAAVIAWIRNVGDPWIKSAQPPAEGSPLAGDDKIEPKVSHIARFGIATAVDHLGSVIDAMESDRPFRHYAPLTTLRTALEVSARTQWLLTPAERKERQLRALRIDLENMIEMRKAVNSLTGDHMPEDLVKGREDTIKFLDGKIQDLKESATDLRPGTNLSPPPDTASLLQKLVDAHTWEGQAVRHLWRTGSAAAHGHYWARIQNLKPQEWNEEEFNTSLYGAMLLVKGALEMYERRACCYL